MKVRTYDTRNRAEILAASHFAPFWKNEGLQKIAQRELRTLDQFFVFAAERCIEIPEVGDFLAFTEADKSSRRLENLRTAFDRLLPEDAPVLQTIRDAIGIKKPRSRVCRRISRATLKSDPLMAPYSDLAAFGEVALENLRVFAQFLAFIDARQITAPSVNDYLEFAADVASTRRLRSLKVAIEAIQPGSPAAHVILAEAIKQKRSPRASTAGSKPRPPALRRVPLSSLPLSWQTLLRNMRMGVMPEHKRVPALSVIDSMEDVLREYAKVQIDAGAVPKISIEGVRRLEASRAAHALQQKMLRYEDQGNRPATRHTAVMRIRQFAHALDLDPLLCAALQAHEKNLRRASSTVVALKFSKLDSLPTLAETWTLATRLLAQSTNAPRRKTKLRLLNEAVILALWTLLPLRLRDGQLRWGKDVTYDGSCYWVGIITAKQDKPLRVRLHRVLIPFLDALVLRGINASYLDEMRDRAFATELPLFGSVDGRMLSSRYPSKVWRAHMGTGAHISRSRIHSELGQLGPDGVDAALALNAQRDESSRKFYQGRAVAAAQRQKGQDMINGLLTDCMREL